MNMNSWKAARYRLEIRLKLFFFAFFFLTELKSFNLWELINLWYGMAWYLEVFTSGQQREYYFHFENTR